MTPQERMRLIERYARGPRALRAAYDLVPEEMRQWRPAPDQWSVHQIVCHCADAEMSAGVRIRMIAAESDPQIIAFDQDAWAVSFDYHNRSAEHALDVIDSVRQWTAPILPRLSEDQWNRVGQHSESGPYSATDWLTIYGDHLHEHVDQISANVVAWNNRTGA